jgi:large subunit ribosomal protein L9
MSIGMKVLLCQDVKELGWLGDVVEVSAGYARNYLLAQGLAMVPTEANLRALAEEKARRAEKRISERECLEKASAAVDGAEAVIASRANEQGHLFGSVTASEVAQNLREQGFEVADSIVQLPEHIKEVGSYAAKLKFAEDLIVSINIVVVAEQDEANEPADQDK